MQRRGSASRLIAPATPAGLTVAMVVLLVALMVETIVEDPGRIGQDFRYYRDLGERWVATGAFYLDRQLDGEYQLALMADVLYPPTALALFVPIAVLPDLVDAVAWWTIPVLVVSRQIGIQRPARWTWPVAMLLLLWPRSYGSVLWGNTDIWIVAAVSGGLQWGWPALLALLKPSFAPLALVGVRHRSWWLGAGVLAALTIAATPLWLDYVSAMTSIRGLGLDYSLFNLPITLVPLVLHAGRKRSAPLSVGQRSAPQPARM